MTRAFRRGHTYGTIRVDLSVHRPVDLRSRRSAESFARWLKGHPGFEVMSRKLKEDERAGEFLALLDNR